MCEDALKWWLVENFVELVKTIESGNENDEVVCVWGAEEINASNWPFFTSTYIKDLEQLLLEVAEDKATNLTCFQLLLISLSPSLPMSASKIKPFDDPNKMLPVLSSELFSKLNPTAVISWSRN